jgi:hypothetical protein
MQVLQDTSSLVRGKLLLLLLQAVHDQQHWPYLALGCVQLLLHYC